MPASNYRILILKTQVKENVWKRKYFPFTSLRFLRKRTCGDAASLIVRSTASNMVFRTFFSFRNLLHSFSLVLLFNGATNMARKNVQKTTFDSTFEMIRHKPIRKQEKE